MSCYFRARGKQNAALQFAEKALKIGHRYKDAENLARTHLNYAVLLGSMGRHEEAVEHIEAAISLLHDEDGAIVERDDQEVVSMLVAAYHNMYVELHTLR